MGTELEKGRNLWAESSGGQIRKGPKPLGRILWGSNPKRAETSGNHEY